MPNPSLNAVPLVKGLEKDRIYAIVGLIQLKNDSMEYQVHPHCLSIIYNPYIVGDPRKNNEMWSKEFLTNTKKNQK
jgi:hypothetical protein